MGIRGFWQRSVSHTCKAAAETAIDKRLQPLHRRLYGPTVLFVALLCIGTFGYYAIGKATDLPGTNLRTCLYQTGILLTGVGFGDVLESHRTWGATLFTVVLCFLGLSILLYVISTVTAFIVGGELTRYLEVKRMEKRIAALTGHHIICGAGETGRHIVDELVATQRPFVVIENDPARVERIRAAADVCYLLADASDDDTLLAAGIGRAKGLVSSLPNDKDNLLVVITARQLNPKLRIISRCVQLDNRRKLMKAGADGVVFPNMIGGMRMVSELVRPTVVTFLDTMLRDRRAIRFENVRLPAGHELVGQTLAEVALWKTTDINVIAARRANEEDFIYNPRGNLQLEEGMDLVIVGGPEAIRKAAELLRLPV